MRAARIVPVLLVALLAAGCAGDDGLAVPAPDDGAAAALPASGASAAPELTPRPQPDCGDPAASYPALATLPAPGRMPAGSTMERIRRRGRLIVGTAGDKPLLAARDPETGKLSGIDIELAREVARAIFGNPGAVEFRTITYAAREQAITGGLVDLVAHSMTITCDRWARVAFSTAYFDDGQRVLVRSDDPAAEIEDLAGRRLCVARGTTTIDNLRNFPGPVVVGVDDAADCLVLFQGGQVDAITSNDIILRGYLVQDPYAKIIGRDLSAEPRGLGISRQHPDLVAFVNAVLERLRRDGTLQGIYDRNLAGLGVHPKVPAAVYGRRP